MLAYIRSKDARAALGVKQRARRVLHRLEKFPDSGRHIPEFPDLPHREVIIRPYRFFYRREGKIIWVVAIWHGAQRPEPPSLERETP